MKKKMMVLGFVLLTSTSFAGAVQAMEMTGTTGSDSMMKKDSAMMQKDAMVMELMKKVEALNALIMVEKDKMMKKDGAAMEGGSMTTKDAMMSGETMKKEGAMMEGGSMMKKDAMMSNEAMMDGDLSEGARGDAVVKLQSFLEENGHLTIPAGVAKGYFGALTKMALSKYQKSVGLNNAGYYGPLTRAAMSKAMMKGDAMMEKKGETMMEKKGEAMMEKTQ